MGVGWLLVFAVILAAVFIAVTAIRRRREPAGAVLIPPPPGTFSIQVTRGIAMLWALLGTAGTLWAAASALFSPSVPVPPRANPLWPAGTIVLDVTSAIVKSLVSQLAWPPSAVTPARWIVPT